MWAVRSPAAKDIWFGCLAVVLNLDDVSVSPCNLSKTGQRLLLMGWGAAEQMGSYDFVVRDRVSPGYIFIVTSESSLYFHNTTGSHLYGLYISARKKLRREALVIETVKIPPRSVSDGHGHVQLAGNGWRSKYYIRHHSYLIPKKK